MALLVKEPTGSEYAIAEQELQDHILSTYGSYDSDVDLFRPNLADHHKVGFFSQDRTSQTNLTEIVDLKEMTEVLQVLLQDVAKLRRDINFTKHVMQADYEVKLKEKSLELYCRINERVAELEKMHDERVGTLRRAFRQQLSDAIARVAVLYSKNLERKIRHEKKKHESDADRIEEKYKELQATIQRNENIIQMLRMQLAQYQKEPSIHDSPSGSSGRPSAATPPTPSVSSEEEESMSMKSKSPSINHEAEELREELEKLNKKYEQLEEAFETGKEEATKLNNNIDELNEKLSAEKMVNEQLRFENNQLKHGMEQDKESSKKMEDGLERQKAEFDRVMQEQIRKAKEESLSAAQREAQTMKETERDKYRLLMDQKKLLEEQLVKEKAKNNAKSKEDMDADKFRKVEERMKEEIQRLKREIERVHKTWEKKFAILQQSLHALKDESYLRQTLQRQSAALHHAAVSYSVDTPVGIIPSSKSSPMKRPLPEITKFKAGNPGSGAAGPDFLSYTVSAPSGRGTAMFSVEENQIMSEQDKDDMPTDIVPLPDPPSRKPPSRCSNEGRPDSRGKVVVVPHVTA